MIRSTVCSKVVFPHSFLPITINAPSYTCILPSSLLCLLRLLSLPPSSSLSSSFCLSCVFPPKKRAINCEFASCVCVSISLLTFTFFSPRIEFGDFDWLPQRKRERKRKRVWKPFGECYCEAI